MYEIQTLILCGKVDSTEKQDSFCLDKSVPRWEFSFFPQKQTADMGNYQQQIREAAQPKVLPVPHSYNAHQQLAANRVLNE